MPKTCTCSGQPNIILSEICRTPILIPLPTLDFENLSKRTINHGINKFTGDQEIWYPIPKSI